MLCYRTVLFLTLVAACRERPPGVSRSPASLQAPIVDQSYITLGGSAQYVEITRTSDTAPVLLFIHGGPGWPQTPMLRYLNRDLPGAVTLVSWDQRGAGLSFKHDSAPPNVTLEQIVADGHELTQLLKARFHQQRIYLAGFSWGSVVGVLLVERYPEDYAAYLGVSQVISIHRGEQLTRDWLGQQAQQAGDTATLRVLDQLAHGDRRLCKSEMACFIAQYQLLAKYRGAVYNPASEAAVARAMAAYPDYAAYDWHRGFGFSVSHLEPAVFGTDLSRVRSLAVPVFLLVGRHDWNIPPALSTAWLAELTAPAKEVIWFEQSGHGPLEEEPGAFDKAIARIVVR